MKRTPNRQRPAFQIAEILTRAMRGVPPTAANIVRELRKYGLQPIRAVIRDIAGNDAVVDAAVALYNAKRHTKARRAVGRARFVSGGGCAGR